MSGANGSATGTAFTVNQGAFLTLDNTGTNNNNRIAGTLTMNGGELIVNGNAAANTAELLGTLNLASGYSIITLNPNALRNTRLSFTDMNRSAGALALFRGTSLGANTIASATVNTSNIEFSTIAPTLSGAGNAATNTVGIISGAIGATTSASAGTDFVTYNPTGEAGGSHGVRPLAGRKLNITRRAPLARA